MNAEYLAGFFDGEGCIDVQTAHRTNAAGEIRYYCRPRVRVSQASSGAFVLHALAKQFGGHITDRSHGGKQQDSTSWEFLGTDRMIDFLERITPHLILKREQARLALWWLHNMSNKRADVEGAERLEDARRAFAEELKMMKLDPQRLSEEAVSRIQALVR